VSFEGSTALAGGEAATLQPLRHDDVESDVQMRCLQDSVLLHCLIASAKRRIGSVTSRCALIKPGSSCKVSRPSNRRGTILAGGRLRNEHDFG
jgi:hypothetical protein